jgi:hypothetical protein
MLAESPAAAIAGRVAPWRNDIGIAGGPTGSCFAPEGPFPKGCDPIGARVTLEGSFKATVPHTLARFPAAGGLSVLEDA